MDFNEASRRFAKGPNSLPLPSLPGLVQESSRVKNELTYAGSLAKAGSVAVRGIYWDPSMDVTSISTAQGLAFPVQLHNSFLLEEPCVNRLLGTYVGITAVESRKAAANLFHSGSMKGMPTLFQQSSPCLLQRERQAVERR